MFRYLIFKHKNQKFQEFPFWVHEGFIILLLLYCKLKIKKNSCLNYQATTQISFHHSDFESLISIAIYQSIFEILYGLINFLFARMCFKIQHRSFAQIGLFIV